MVEEFNARESGRHFLELGQKSFESNGQEARTALANSAGYDFQPFVSSVISSGAEVKPQRPSQLSWIDLLPKGAPIADIVIHPPAIVPPKGAAHGAGAQDKIADRPVYDADESKITKVAREGLVLGAGLGRSMLYGMANLPQRLPEIGTSMAIGASLSVISKTGAGGAAATFVVGCYFTSRFILNAINDTDRWNKFGAAVNDTWHSNQRIGKNIRDVSDTGGDFAFNTGLSMASGYVGFKNKALGDLIISVIKLPIPMPAEVPIPATILGASIFMDIVPAPLLYKSHKNHDQ
jgi:hypothetical protein